MTDLNTAVVAGTGAYLPEKILTNQDLEKSLDTSDATHSQITVPCRSLGAELYARRFDNYDMGLRNRP